MTTTDAPSPSPSSSSSKTPPAVQLRLVQPSDQEHAPAIHALINKAYRSEGGWTTEHHLVKDERISLSELVSAMQDPINPLMLAFDPITNEPLGTIQIEPVEHFPDYGAYNADGYTCSYQEQIPKEQQILLGLFSVSPLLQGKGVGRYMVMKALEHAKLNMGRTQGVVYVIQQRTELVDWYKRLGFVDYGEKMPFPVKERMLQDDVHFTVMRKAL